MCNEYRSALWKAKFLDDHPLVRPEGRAACLPNVNAEFLRSQNTRPRAFLLFSCSFLSQVCSHKMTELSEAALDIHALAVLTVYESTAYEPRFRHVKLREIGTTVQFEQAVIHEGPPNDPFLRPWFTSKARRHGYLWKPSTEACGDEPDTPGNMIAEESGRTGHRSVIGLTEEQKETIFYQARMHVSAAGQTILLEYRLMIDICRTAALPYLMSLISSCSCSLPHKSS